MVLLKAKHHTDVPCLFPKEAWAVLEQNQAAMLVDVRTEQEWHSVGVPNLESLQKHTLLLSWRELPGMGINSAFVSELEQHVADKSTPLLFICRSGIRSDEAAKAALAAGYENCTNIKEGFEGDAHTTQQRGENWGWVGAKLPQSHVTQ